jgi:uncharacterized membrane protein YeaQ/YmgE (transglycosylase-associated protein family)
MSKIVWILLGLGLGLGLGVIASKVVSTTGEGTVVDILLGIFGAVLGGWLFDVFGGTCHDGFRHRQHLQRCCRHHRRCRFSGALPRPLPPPNAMN